MLGRALAAFFRDLLSGDPVALGLVCGFACFLLALASVGVVIVLKKRIRDAEFRRRRERKEQREDDAYRKMNPPTI